MVKIRAADSVPKFIFRSHIKELVEYQRKLIHKICCFSSNNLSIRAKYSKNSYLLYILSRNGINIIKVHQKFEVHKKISTNCHFTQGNLMYFS